MDDLELARFAIDDAIDKWLLMQGFSPAEISDLDYSTINEELNYYVSELTNRKIRYLLTKKQVSGLDKAERLELNELLKEVEA